MVKAKSGAQTANAGSESYSVAKIPWGQPRVVSSPTLATKTISGMFLSLVEHSVWGGGVEGSNPSIPITYASVAQLDRAIDYKYYTRW